MKVVLTKKALSEALSLVGGTMASSGGDLSSHYLFRAPPGNGGKSLEILSFLGSVRSGSPVEATVHAEDQEAFTIEGKRLKRWLSSLPDMEIELEFNGKVVSAFAPGKGYQKFQSLDPSKFPYWDADIKIAKPTAKFSAERWASAIHYATAFTSDQETREPQLCVCEAKEGALSATDKVSIVKIYMHGMDGDCRVRIHRNDSPKIISFLSGYDGEVELREFDRGIFFVRDDNAIFGEARFQADHPEYTPITNDYEFVWELNKEQLKKNILFLTAGAAWDDHRLQFSREDAGSPLLMSMRVINGEISTVPIEERGTEGNTGTDPKKFSISHLALSKLISLSEGDTLRLGVNRKSKTGGFVRNSFERFGDENGDNADRYLTTFVFLI